MNIVLVLNKTEKDLRVMVNAKAKELKSRVIRLLEEDKDREAFDLLLREAEVVRYLPQGCEPVERADLVLMEDLLR